MNNDRKILVLYKNGSLKNENEIGLKRKDFSKISYVAINTNKEDKEPRNFLINKMSSLFDFDKAYIEYQLMFYSNYEDDGIPLEEEILEPVRFETNSISDVLTMINCMDRLNCVNNIISNTERCGPDEHIEIAYFGLKLIKDNREIYNKYYQYNSSIHTYYSYRIIKYFKDIYSYDITGELFKHNSYIYIHKDETWSIEDKIYNKGLIGIPLLWSNTVTFCTKKELDVFKNCNTIFCTHCAVDCNDIIHNEIDEYVKKGKYDKVEEIGCEIDYFNHAYNNIYLIKYNKYAHIDILSHLSFILSMSDIVFDSLYNSQITGNDNKSAISVLSIIFYYRDKIEKEIYFTKNTVIPLSQLFNIF